jgi:hypothetical protein
VAEFPSRAVAPPNRISRGPMYPGVPSSPTAGTAVSVCPHLHPGPSSFFSITAFTTVYPGAGFGPAAPAAPGFDAAAGVPGVDGADDAEVSLPDPEPPAVPPRAAAVASESQSDSVVMRESTSISQQAEPPEAPLGFEGPEISTRTPATQAVAPPYAAATITGTLDSLAGQHDSSALRRGIACGGQAREAGEPRLPRPRIAALRSRGRGQRAARRRGGGQGVRIQGTHGKRAANLGRTTGRRGLVWLEWRRRAATGGRGREDEVEEKEWKWERKFSNVFFFVLFGADLSFRPRASSGF